MQHLENNRLAPVIREQQEAFEEQYLAPQAAKAAHSRGREEPESECPLRTCFQRDRDRVIHSKAFRRLKHKTQVFIAPEGDHYRTRLTHTLEVSQISRTIARALRLNEDLTEAIVMAHDLGHTPFGHAGERVFDALLPDGFEHNAQSVRVVTVLEPMNLTWEVRDGMLHHTGPGTAATLEGQIVKIADRVAYLNHDIDDALRAGILRQSDLPSFVYETFGVTKGRRIAAMVMDLVRESARDYASIRMSEAFHERFLELRAFMFKRVYLGSKAKTEEGKAQRILEQLFQYYCAHPDELASELGRPVDDTQQAAVDYIAGMTDRFAIQQYENLFVPRPWRLGDELRRDM
ncbi:MAG TPA: deoxyguanosinetriphosphate triphosphohydrolase [Oscillatoriaceae cyanobacterium]